MKKDIKITDMKKVFCDAELIPERLIEKYYLLTVDLMGTHKIENYSIIFKELKRCISELDDRDKVLLSSRYGISNGKILSLEKIALRNGISRERVRQIILVILKNLKSKKTNYHIIHKIQLLRHKKAGIEKEISYYENIINSSQNVEITFEDFAFSARVLNALRREGIKTYEQLISLTPQKIRDIRGLGVKCAEEIWYKLYNEHFPFEVTS